MLAWWATPFLFPTSQESEKLKKMWWLLPLLPFGFIQAWLDPLIAFFAGLALWAKKNKRYGWLIIAIAFAASIKQYGFLIGFFILLALLMQKEWKVFFRLFFYSFVLFFLLVAPFLFWNLDALIHSTIQEIFDWKPRMDSFTMFNLGTSLSNPAVQV